MNIFKRSAYATVSQLKRNQCTILSIFGHFMSFSTQLRDNSAIAPPFLITNEGDIAGRMCEGVPLCKHSDDSSLSLFAPAALNGNPALREQFSDR